MTGGIRSEMKINIFKSSSLASFSTFFFLFRSPHIIPIGIWNGRYRLKPTVEMKGLKVTKVTRGETRYIEDDMKVEIQ